jgi:hypothetical protein
LPEEELLLLDLMNVLKINWKVWGVLEKGPPSIGVTRGRVTMILHFLTTRREDAHADPPMTAYEFSAYIVGAAVLDRALDFCLESGGVRE